MGYEANFNPPLDHKYKCPICLCALEDPNQRCVLGPFFKPRTRKSIFYFLFSGTRTRTSILFFLFPRTRKSKGESLKYPCFFKYMKYLH